MDPPTLTAFRTTSPVGVGGLGSGLSSMEPPGPPWAVPTFSLMAGTPLSGNGGGLVQMMVTSATSTNGSVSTANTAVAVAGGTGCARRKRNGDDESSASSSAIDSMRPVVAPRRKRRRTFVDAFSNISLVAIPNTSASGGENAAAGASGTEDDDDLDSSRAVGDPFTDDVHSTSSSLEDDPSDTNGGGVMVDDETKDYGSVGHMAMSNQDRVERKVMFELVFGTSAEQHLQQQRHPADKKLEELIRRQMLERMADTSNFRVQETQDDMNIDAVYHRGTVVPPSVPGDAPMQHKRSNSLPEDIFATMDMDGMDMD